MLPIEKVGWISPTFKSNYYDHEMTPCILLDIDIGERLPFKSIGAVCTHLKRGKETIGRALRDGTVTAQHYRVLPADAKLEAKV